MKYDILALFIAIALVAGLFVELIKLFSNLLFVLGLSGAGL